ncbi:RTX-I toxin determinant A [Streptomyces sp. YIM 121038]|uniref:DUF11 domain-containing protein n=1 Tax=Streptomyces sp. YIM 121038 TaxID=2136401 RepID=UPI00111090EA|nr:DUF11 domain-containing protein [Streptomyces sp. YIM 121038]QCX79689.1 RTX-I toxin determinant A [Streptomyces sp. YIM 121038]
MALWGGLLLALSGLLGVASPAAAAAAPDAVAIILIGPDDSADPVRAGTSYTYRYSVTGSGDLTHAVSTLNLYGAPATATATTSSQGSCSTTARTSTCDLGRISRLAPVDVEVTVTPHAAGAVTAYVEASADGATRPVRWQSTTITAAPGADPAVAAPGADPAVAAPGADLAVAVADSADPFALGGILTDTVTLTNNGSDDATGATAEIALTGVPTGILTARSSQGSCTVSGPTVRCALGGLAASGSATVVLSLSPTATGTVTATATAAADQPDPNTGDNSAARNTAVNNANGCTLVGSNGSEVLSGVNRDDVICALAGDDIVFGAGGNDIVYSGAGDDTVGGGDGNDTLVDHHGTDTLKGNAGDDTVDVRDGLDGDTADGGSGADSCAVDTGDTATNC